ncbi:MAG: VWA domain-containing protein [Bdellovibrionota bacterium]
MKRTKPGFISKIFVQQTAGMSILEAVIAAGMLGVLGAIIMKSFAHRMHSMEFIKAKSSIEDVRDYVRSYFSCTETNQMAQSQCSKGGYIEIRDHDGKVLVAKPSKKKGYHELPNGFLIKANCNVKDMEKIEFQVAKAGESPDASSTAKSIRDKSFHFRDLFNGVPVTCPSLDIIHELEEKNKRKWRWDDSFVKNVKLNAWNEGEVDISNCSGSIPSLRVNVIFDNSGSQLWNDPTNIRGNSAKLFLSRLSEVKSKIPSANFYVSNIQFSSDAVPGSLGWSQVDTGSLSSLYQEVEDLTQNPGGGTIYSKALELSHQHFSQLSPWSDTERNYVVFMTDGQPNVQEIYTAFNRGENLENVEKSVNALLDDHNVAIFGVATGESLPVWAEDLVEKMSLPKNNSKTKDHIGHYVRAKNDMDFRIVWDDIFEEISKCKIRDCAHYGGTKPYATNSQKKKKKSFFKQVYGIKNVTTYDSPYKPGDVELGEVGDACYRYEGIKPVGSICQNWNDAKGLCGDKKWPDDCVNWDARFGICRDPGPATCSNWNPNTFRCEDPKPSGCTNWNDIKAVCEDP